MPQMIFDLEDGKPPVSFVLRPEDCARFVAFMRECDEGKKDAERYRWMCGNNFDREGSTQVHTWLQTWEPHSQTGEPTEWTQRIRGSALDAVIDAAMAAEQTAGAA